MKTYQLTLAFQKMPLIEAIAAAFGVIVTLPLLDFTPLSICAPPNDAEKLPVTSGMFMESEPQTLSTPKPWSIAPLRKSVWVIGKDNGYKPLVAAFKLFAIVLNVE